MADLGVVESDRLHAGVLVSAGEQSWVCMYPNRIYTRKDTKLLYESVTNLSKMWPEVYDT